jgi:hypothetical protein
VADRKRLAADITFSSPRDSAASVPFADERRRKRPASFIRAANSLPFQSNRRNNELHFVAILANKQFRAVV